MSDYEHPNLFGNPEHNTYPDMYLTSDFDSTSTEIELSALSDLPSGMNMRPTLQAWADQPAWNPSKLSAKQAYPYNSLGHDSMDTYRSRPPSITTTSVSHDNDHDVFTSPSSVYDPGHTESLQGESLDSDSGLRRSSLRAGSGIDEPQPNKKRRRIANPKVSPASPSSATPSSPSSSSSSYVAPAQRSKKPTLRRNDPSEYNWKCDFVFPADGDGDHQIVCCEPFRIESDLKKHMDKHTRPHKCICKPCASGFTTASDLDRHHWAAHDIVPAKGASIWYCPMTDCPGKYAKDSRALKTWKRKDNFKQHVERIHKKDLKGDDDVAEIVRQSQVHVASSDFVYENGTFVLQRQLGDFQGGPIVFEDAKERGFEMQHVPHHYSGCPRAPSSSNRLHRASVNSNGQLPPPNQPLYHYAPGSQSTSSTASSYSSAWPSQSSSRTSASIGDEIRCRKENIMISAGNPRESLPPRQTLKTASHRSAHLQARMAAVRQTRPHLEMPAYPGYHQQQAYPVKGYHNMHQQRPTHDVQPHWPTQIETPTLYSNYPVVDARVNVDQSIPTEARTSSVQKKSTNKQVKTGRQTVEAPKAQSHVIDDQVRGARKQPRRQHMCEHVDEEGKPCNKTFPSKSNLQKHKTRHQKLYGCTYDECPTSRRFGSKNDWKRHEEKQHPEGIKREWRCNLCVRLFEKRKTFSDHMQDRHPQIEIQEEDHQINVVQGGGFWCGFCKKVIAIERESFEAKDDRFNHIGKHFYPAKLDISDWQSPTGARKQPQLDKGRAIIHKAKRHLQRQDDSDDEQSASSHRTRGIDTAAESDNDSETTLEDASGDEEEDHDPQPSYSCQNNVGQATGLQQHSSDYRQYHDPSITRQGLSLPIQADSPHHARLLSRTMIKPWQEPVWTTCCKCGVTSAINGLCDGGCMAFGFGPNSTCNHRYCNACHYAGS